MCGRFAQFSPVALMKEALGISEAKSGDFRHSYNVAPAQNVLAAACFGETVLTDFLWGIELSPVKAAAKPLMMINARVETISEKPSFRESFRSRRCLIPADGFYEWKRMGANKQPWFFKQESNLPFAFAGIWEKIRAKDGSIRPAFAIITTEAKGTVSQIHSRMPVILDKAAYGNWLDPHENNPKKLEKIIKEGALINMIGYPVSKMVNSVSNNDPSCIEPV